MQYNHPVYRSGLSNKAIQVYTFLYEHSNREGECFHSVKTIARMLNISVSTVKRGITEIEKKGFMTHIHRFRLSGGKTSNKFFLNYKTSKRSL